ncbi:MAG TPA: hypothetical protein PKK18_07105 [Chitinophagales bacterium]|nr:hypothetical protein [Chitinophagales bacterium]HNA39875.1 hypothetical protein [Chitinophagales bacterium]HNC73188.1 hypothetical protein [Chitinophagales bacterium]HNN26187.1 hypothetical protein [Chitinophagales bacterium]HNO01203.1 hypothetical protein [Chitinophagales bacterium]
MKNYVFLLLSLTLLATSTFAQENWKLEKDKNGIKVWNRKVAGTAIKEFKVSTIINTSTEKMLAFLKNTAKYDQWMYKVDEGSVKVLKRVSDNDYYTYMTISAPFIKTRETITHMTFNSQDAKGAILINLEAAPNLLPLNDKYVRIPKMKAYFKIVPLGNGQIELIHQALGSSGGSIPEALINLTSVDCPFYMFTKIKSMI